MSANHSGEKTTSPPTLTTVVLLLWSPRYVTVYITLAGDWQVMKIDQMKIVSHLDSYKNAARMPLMTTLLLLLSSSPHERTNKLPKKK